MHLNYVYAAVIRPHDQGNIHRDVFVWGLQFQRVKVHDHDDREHGTRQVKMALGPLLRTHIM